MHQWRLLVTDQSEFSGLRHTCTVCCAPIQPARLITVCSPVPNVSQQPHGWASPQLGGTLALPVDSRPLSILLTAVARSSSFGVRGAHLYEGFFRVHLRLFHVKQPGMCPFCRESVACGRQVGTYSTRIQRFM